MAMPSPPGSATVRPPGNTAANATVPARTAANDTLEMASAATISQVKTIRCPAFADITWVIAMAASAAQPTRAALARGAPAGRGGLACRRPGGPG